MSVSTPPLPSNHISQWLRLLFIQYLSGKAFDGHADFNDAFLSELEHYDDGLAEQEEPAEVLDIDESDDRSADDSGRYHRILLDVEKERIERDEKAKRIFQAKLAKVSNNFDKRFLQTLTNAFEEDHDVFSKFLDLDAGQIKVLVLIAKGNPSLSDIATALSNYPTLGNRVMRLVRNPLFMSYINRQPRDIKALQPAVGMLGIKILRVITPALIFKKKIRSECEHLALTGKKLWRFMTAVAQACSFILSKRQCKDNHKGILLGCMYCLGYIAIYNRFGLTFESLKVSMLSQVRNSGDKMLHDLLFAVPANPEVFEKFIDNSVNDITLACAQFSLCDKYDEIIQAIKEQASGSEYVEKSELGQVLQQAVVYAMLEQLEKVKLVNPKLIKHILEENHLSETLYRELNRRRLYKINLS